jgi:hypothetical protein
MLPRMLPKGSGGPDVGLSILSNYLKNLVDALGLEPRTR